MEKNKIVKELTTIFWLFIIGSVIGYITEMIVVLFQKSYFESRKGLIYGPFIPVYGIGLIIYYLILKNIKTKNKVKIFLITAIIGGIAEYMSSFIQEKAFGTISWDYTNLIFNINGRTSLLHCTYWGIAGILYMQIIIPLIQKLKPYTIKKGIKVFTIISVILMSINISISYVAANRQTERRNNIPANSKLDIFLDEHYPDELMDKVYANKKEVV